MADFNEVPPLDTEEDPAAEFLAREQDQLAGLEDDNYAEEQTHGAAFDPFGGDSEQQSAPLENDAFSEPQVTDMSPDMSDNEYMYMPMTNGPTDAYAAIAHVDRQREEPEQIKIWREEQKARLETKDSDEEVKINEWREAAKKEIEDWYKHYHEQRIKTCENNQTAEQSFIEQRDDVSEGKEWEKICNLCEFNPKSSKMTKDVSRMRSVLLQLKQTPLIRN